MPPRTRSLDVQIASEIFGWTWRDAWNAWCPPGWYDGHTRRPPEHTLHQLLEREGGTYWGIDEHGNPSVPAYRHHPEDTQIVWNWLHRQRTTVTLDLTGETWVSHVTGPESSAGTGLHATGEGHGTCLGEAVGGAALAYARAQQQAVRQEG
jgi:hypothetical protein